MPSALTPSKTSSISQIIGIVFEEAVPIISFGMHQYDNNKELPLNGTLALIHQVVDALKKAEEESAIHAPLIIAA